MKTLITALALAILLPAAALAHQPRPGPNGGLMVDAGSYHAELLADGSEWEIKGNIVDHEYEIKGPHGDIAEVSKKWFRVRDTYGVKVEAGNDVVLVLALTAAVDSMTDHD